MCYAVHDRWTDSIISTQSAFSFVPSRCAPILRALAFRLSVRGVLCVSLRIAGFCATANKRILYHRRNSCYKKTSPAISISHGVQSLIFGFNFKRLCDGEYSVTVTQLHSSALLMEVLLLQL